MALPAVPSALRGVSQLRGPVFDPRTGTYVYPGFSGSGLSTTGTPPVTQQPTTPSPPPPPTTAGNPLGMTGSGGGAGLRGIQADRVRTGGDGRRGNPGRNGRVDLTGPMGDVLDAVGTLAPGPLGAVATAAKAGMAYNNADINRDQLRDVGYTPGLSDAQMAGAVLGQVSPMGVVGNSYGDGSWRSVMDASVQAQRGYYTGDQTFTDPTGMKTSPAGPVGVPNAQTIAAAKASAAPPAGAPPTGIRSVQAGGSQRSVVDRQGREVTDPDIRSMGMLGGTKATGPRPTAPERARSGGEGRSNRGEPRDHDPGEGRSSATGRGTSDGSPGTGGMAQGGI